jgi:hypothetical protein
MRSGIGDSPSDPFYVSQVGAGSVAMPTGTTADPLYVQPSNLPAGTDRSGTANTTATVLAAANASRHGLNVQNIGANNIGINETGGTAAIGTPGTYTLTPGSSTNVRTNRAISVIAVTGATAYSATEF